MKELTFLIVAIVSLYVGYLFSQSKKPVAIIHKEIKNIENIENIENKIQPQRQNSGCMLGCSPCYPLCAGEGNPCGLVAPVPSPMWQPQSASTVARRLKEGNYTKENCN